MHSRTGLAALRPKGCSELSPFLPVLSASQSIPHLQRSCSSSCLLSIWPKAGHTCDVVNGSSVSEVLIPKGKQQRYNLYKYQITENWGCPGIQNDAWERTWSPGGGAQKLRGSLPASGSCLPCDPCPVSTANPLQVSVLTPPSLRTVA